MRGRVGAKDMVERERLSLIAVLAALPYERRALVLHRLAQRARAALPDDARRAHVPPERRRRAVARPPLGHAAAAHAHLVEARRRACAESGRAAPVRRVGAVGQAERAGRVGRVLPTGLTTALDDTCARAAESAQEGAGCEREREKDETHRR